MTLSEIIELLKARLNYLAFLRGQAASMGDIERVTSLDKEIADTSLTLARIEGA